MPPESYPASGRQEILARPDDHVPKLFNAELNIIMKAFAPALGVILVMIVSGCTQGPVCNNPYIIKGSQCCLDHNNNSICDSDESSVVEPSPVSQKNYQPYEVKMYIQQDLPNPDYWYKLPSIPYKSYDGYQIFSYPQDPAYYDGGWLLLYTNYTEEPVECLVKEYHDSIFFIQTAVKLTPKGYSGNVSGMFIHALFSTEATPKFVRYEINCTGDQSGLTFRDAFVVGLKPP